MSADVRTSVRAELRRDKRKAVKAAKNNGVPVPVQALEAPIRILHRGTMIAPLLQQLEAAPELWDENVFRTESPVYTSPHQKISDIIVRFNDWANWTGDRAAFNAEHESVWWGAYDKLPFIQPLVFDLMRMFYAERLGMVLITRIPPKCNVEKHVDKGWHAQHYLKFGLQLKSAPGQRFCFEGYSLETKPGDLFAFDNSKVHWVENPTDEERITMIICMRLEGPHCLNYKYSGSVKPDVPH
jgi:hypothetical protein